MLDRLDEGIKGGLQRTGDWLRCSIDQWRSCRECGGQVKAFAQICGHCGARNPVKISAVQGVVLGAALSETLLLLLCFA